MSRDNPDRGTDTSNIRKGTPSDLPALRAVQSAVLAEPWHELLTVAVDGPPLLLVATSPADAPSLDSGDTPIGYALAVTDGDDEAAYLAELAIAPDNQGQGHGSALLTALVEELRERGQAELRVTVRVVDERARAFYRERGFERRERIADHYESGDGFLLVRELG